MVNKTQDQKSEEFKAFSTMKMPSLWDVNKIKDAHMKNLATLKETHGIVSETFKKVADAHAKHLKKHHAEARSDVNELAAKVKADNTVRDHVGRVKVQHAEVVEKLKVSHENVLNNFKEKVEALKQHHAKIHEKFSETQRVNAEKLKAKMKVVQDHHTVVANTWKDSTQKIMDLMKKTADHHLSNH